MSCHLICHFEIIGERKNDDLECFECDSIGDVVIVACKHCEQMRDLCESCVASLLRKD